VFSTCPVRENADNNKLASNLSHLKPARLCSAAFAGSTTACPFVATLMRCGGRRWASISWGFAWDGVLAPPGCSEGGLAVREPGSLRNGRGVYPACHAELAQQVGYVHARGLLADE